MAELNGKKILFSPRVIVNGGGSYVLPTASADTLGGIKVGNNLSIDANGVLSATGGGGSSVPVFELEWHDNPTEEQRIANSAVLSNIRATILDNNNEIIAGACRVFIRSAKFCIEAYKIYVPATGIIVYGFDGSDKETAQLYEIKLIGTAAYNQSLKILPEDVFDDESNAAGSMAATAEYIDGLLENKQDTLTAGTGINISNNVISATGGGGGTTYTAGTGIDITNDTISLDSATQTAISSISGKQNVPSKVTTGTNITLADNTEYRLTNVTTLTLAFPSGNFECWLKLTIASSGTPNVTFPQSASYIGAAPTFANGETWEVSIKDGVVVAAKVTA